MRAEGSLRSVGEPRVGGGSQRFGVFFTLTAASFVLRPQPENWAWLAVLQRARCLANRPTTPINGRTYIGALSRAAAAYIHHEARGQILMPCPPQYWQR